MLCALLFTTLNDPSASGSLLALLSNPGFIAIAVLIVGAIMARKPLHALATWLHADAAHRNGLAKALEDGGGTLADHAQDFLDANGQDVKDLVDPAKRAAAEADLGKKAIAALVAKASVVLLLCTLAFSLPSCATSAAATVNVATNSLDATGKLFLATAATLDAAYDAKLVSEPQYQPWRDFSLRFKAAFAIADKAMVAAQASNDQSVQGVIQAEMAALERELATFQALAAQVAHPTTGPPAGALPSAGAVALYAPRAHSPLVIGPPAFFAPTVPITGPPPATFRMGCNVCTETECTAMACIRTGAL